MRKDVGRTRPQSICGKQQVPVGRGETSEVQGDAAFRKGEVTGLTIGIDFCSGTAREQL